jgi:hypothetical protein
MKESLCYNVPEHFPSIDDDAKIRMVIKISMSADRPTTSKYVP